MSNIQGVTGRKYLFISRSIQLRLEVVDSVEDGRVLAQKVEEGLRERFRLEVPHAAESALVFLVDMPVDLLNLAGRKLGDAFDAGAVIDRRAAVHIGEDKVL